MTPNRYGSTDLDQAVARQIKILIAVTPGVSVASLARDIGMRRATLSARVNGHAGFNPSLIAQVATRLDTTASAIVAAAERSVDTSSAAA